MLTWVVRTVTGGVLASGWERESSPLIDVLADVELGDLGWVLAP